MQLPINAPSLKENRIKLRKNQTHVEFILWSKLRNKQLLGIKFYRQYSIGYYIVDFYCHQYKLVIELDGGQHNEKSRKAYDDKRTQFLNGQGIVVLRFWDNDVINNIKGVLEVIKRQIEERNSP